MSEMKVVLKAEAGSTLTAIGQVQAAADATAKSFNDATRAAAMSSKAAAGSLVDLRQKLAQARGELEKMTEGSDGFAEQAAQVKALATQYDALKKNISEATAVSAGLDDEALRKQAEAARVAAGSVQKLKEQLADAEAELNRLEVGSDAFREQAAVVKSLSGQYESAKTAIKELTTRTRLRRKLSVLLRIRTRHFVMNSQRLNQHWKEWKLVPSNSSNKPTSSRHLPVRWPMPKARWLN